MKTHPVWTSAKVIIVNSEKLLLIKKQRNETVYYTLPGGIQNRNEVQKHNIYPI